MFEPRIVAFLCSWCSYTGADTAGIARLKSPANLHAIRVPCSGRVSPELIMRTFDEGADGVLVLGCHIGECHYDSGNHRAAKRLPVLQALLSFVGLEPERLRLDWVSASEGERFARITTEFTGKVRELGPVHWRVEGRQHHESRAEQPVNIKSIPLIDRNLVLIQSAIREKAGELLSNGMVNCVIGYETSPRGETRPTFIYSKEETERLVWNTDCSHNLCGYLVDKLAESKRGNKQGSGSNLRIGIVVKPCDSRTINVLLAENQLRREEIHVIGVTCDGMREADGDMQNRCLACRDDSPVIHDTLVGESKQKPDTIPLPVVNEELRVLEQATSTERLEFWLNEFDRCIRCYACRQACPLCNCPTCLYERDDSTYVGLGIGLNEKRTFHLGRAYHLAGRCVGCNECERACPVNIPISLLNQKLAEEIEKSFSYRAGMAVTPSPIVTILSGEYKED
jgi:coenzyme F420-reducing hydrogenase delta subunit/ferredoxin